jgi:hypothetical protein
VVCLSAIFALSSPRLYYRWYDDSPVKIKGNRAFPKRKSAATDQTDDQRDRKRKMTIKTSNGSQSAEFTAYSLLFTVREAAAKHVIPASHCGNRGCAKLSVARTRQSGKFTVNFTVPAKPGAGIRFPWINECIDKPRKAGNHRPGGKEGRPLPAASIAGNRSRPQLCLNT